MPGQTAASRTAPDAVAERDLQWRAGQLPGQTPIERQSGSVVELPSFNGGPDNCPARRRRIQRRRPPDFEPERPSMEGRTIARPDAQSTAMWANALNGQVPSMEGRTIARPDHRAEARRRTTLPGCGPSMEGRTIARPDATAVPMASQGRDGAFNGGPDNCPARPVTP